MNHSFLVRVIARALAKTSWLSARDVLPSLVAGVAVLVVTVRAKSDVSPALWSLATFVGCWILLDIVSLARALRLAFPEIRVEDEIARQQSLLQDTTNTNMKGWLRLALAAPGLGVEFAAVFGSVVKSYESRDVDVIIELASGPRESLKARVLAIRALDKTFFETYGKHLHLTLFSASETEDMLRFVREADGIEVLIEGDRWARISAPNI